MMKGRKISNSIFLLFFTLAGLMLFFGCGGGSDGDGHLTYGWKVTIEVTDTGGNPVAALSPDHITISTDSGVVSALDYTDTELSFIVDQMGIQPCMITVTINVPGYYPVTKQFRAAYSALTPESDAEDAALFLFTETPAGTASRSAGPESAGEISGLANVLALGSAVDAGNSRTGMTNVAVNTILGTRAGALSGNMTLTMVVYDGNIATNVYFFPGGTYDGIVVNPTGYNGFTASGADFYTGTVNPILFATVEVRDGSNVLITHMDTPPTCTLTFPDNLTYPGTADTIDIGDTVPFFVYDENTGIWIFVEEATVAASGTAGVLQVTVDWKFPAGAGGEPVGSLNPIPHFGGIFFLSGITGEDQTAPTATGISGGGG